jgi:hypothetical protein
VVLADSTVLGNGILLSDAVLQAQSARINGDEITEMDLEADTGMDYLGY